MSVSNRAVEADPTPGVAASARKVFGVGMNKTGTTSLKRAFTTLGVVPVTAANLAAKAGIVEALFERGDYEPALRYARAYRGFEDRPWNVWEMYRHLDARYPGSRFVLTVRDPDSWWRSVHHWITVAKPHLAERYREHLRADSLERDAMVAGYLRHNREIQDYFAGRPDLLVLDLEAGHGWAELCDFLELPRPAAAFPHTNRQHYDQRDAGRSAHQRRRRVEPTNVGVGVPPSPRCCIRCGERLVGRGGEVARGLGARVPGPARALYRALQRRRFVPTPDGRAEDRTIADLRSAHPGLSLDGMAAVCCFFNPCGYRSRVENYRRFRDAFAASGLPLLTVELAIGGDAFHLEAAGEEILRLRAPDAMWQKERLLNLGIRRLLGRGATSILWLDADVVFDEPRAWPWRVAAELERSRLCQVFGQVTVDQEHGAEAIPGVAAVRYWRDTGRLLNQYRRGPSFRRPLGYPLGYSGFGWAARAEVLDTVELFDRSVVGGGDKLIYAASCGLGPGWAEEVRATLLASTVGPCPVCGHRNRARGFEDAYMAWAGRWHAAVRGEVGHTTATVRSLYHGHRDHRQYNLRRDILLRHEFDPGADLELDASGVWRWASAKPVLHLDVQSYFFERKEDA